MIRRTGTAESETPDQRQNRMLLEAIIRIETQLKRIADALVVTNRALEAMSLKK